MDGITLGAALLAVLGNGLMGYVVWYAWGKAEAWWPAVAGADYELKRVGVALLSFVAVQAPYWFGVLMLIVAAPPTWRDWLMTTFEYASIAFLSATLTHGAAKKKSA